MTGHGTDTNGAGPTVLLFTVDCPPADAYRACLPEGWTFETLEARDDESDKIEKARRADAIVHWDLPLSAAHLDAATRLRLVQRQGVGIDTLDADLFTERGIPVAICPDGTAEAVAEHAVLLMLAAGKLLPLLHREVADRGRWPRMEYRASAIGLAGATVGIVGFGRIGQAVARRLLAFGARILVLRDPGRPLGEEWDPALVRASPSLAELCPQVDVLTLHCALTPETRGLIGRRELDLLPAHATLVNTARGEVVVERDLVDALRAGSIAAAGLDVLEQEPPPADHPLFALDNVVITPHVGSGNRLTAQVKAKAVLGNVRRVWEGEEPLHRVL